MSLFFLDLQISVVKDRQNISFFIKISPFSALHGHSVLLYSKQGGMFLSFFLELQISIVKDRQNILFFHENFSFFSITWTFCPALLKKGGMSLLFLELQISFS